MVNDIEAELRSWLRGVGTVVAAGIGCVDRSDDYVGLKIVEALQGKVRGDVCLLECETVPESYILDIEKLEPTHVLLIDAANIGLEPGESRLVNAEDLVSFSPLSSHALPLRVFCEYLKKTINPKIALLLIQPESLELGEGLTPQVEAAAAKLTAVLTRLLG